jgi:hypothetical protein
VFVAGFFKIRRRSRVIIQTERDRRHWILATVLLGFTAILAAWVWFQTVFRFVPPSEVPNVFVPLVVVILLFSLLLLLRLEFRGHLWRLTEDSLERGQPVNLRIPLEEIESIRIGLPGRFPSLLRLYKQMHIMGWRNMMLRRRHMYVLKLRDGRLFTLELSHIPKGHEVMRKLRRACYDALDRRCPAEFTPEEAHALRWGRRNRFHRIGGLFSRLGARSPLR